MMARLGAFFGNRAPALERPGRFIIVKGPSESNDPMWWPHGRKVGIKTGRGTTIRRGSTAYGTHPAFGSLFGDGLRPADSFTSGALRLDPSSYGSVKPKASRAGGPRCRLQ